MARKKQPKKILYITVDDNGVALEEVFTSKKQVKDFQKRWGYKDRIFRYALVKEEK